VAYIISDEERDAFKRLSNDESANNFIEQFWLRRDPRPIPSRTNSRKSITSALPTQRTLSGGVSGWKLTRQMYIITASPERPPESVRCVGNALVMLSLNSFSTVFGRGIAA